MSFVAFRFNQVWLFNVNGAVWGFVVNTNSFVYMQCFSPQHIVCILKLKQVQSISHLIKCLDRWLLEGFETCLFTSASCLLLSLYWHITTFYAAFCNQLSICGTVCNSSILSITDRYFKINMKNRNSMQALPNSHNRAAVRINVCVCVCITSGGCIMKET